MRKVLPYLTQGVLLCLGGFAFFYLLRKLSSISSADLSETFENEMEELKKWKRSVDLEVEGQFDRVKSMMGRIDRAKRRDSTSQDPPGSEESVPNDLDDQGKLNALMAKRFHGV